MLNSDGILYPFDEPDQHRTAGVLGTTLCRNFERAVVANSGNFVKVHFFF